MQAIESEANENEWRGRRVWLGVQEMLASRKRRAEGAPEDTYLNTWVQHMRLQPDGTDPPGVKLNTNPTLSRTLALVKLPRTLLVCLVIPMNREPNCP